MLNRTLSHICGRWYLPMFLFRDGLLTLIYRASLMVLMRFWSSPPTILKLSMVTVWPEMWKWSCIGEGGLRCSLNLSAKFLADSPMYSSSHSTLSHLYLYMTPLFLRMGSLSFGVMRRFLVVSPPFRCTCTTYLLHVLLKLSLSPWWYGTTICGFWLLLWFGPKFFVLSLFFFMAGAWLLNLTLLRAHVGYLHLFRCLSNKIFSYQG